MNDMQLSVSSEEQTFLIGFLEESLKETRVEEHRTRAPTYREHIVKREEIITRLLEKLGHPASASR